jgi:hypothetical protein
MGKDPFVDTLKRFEYNVVRLPRTNIHPLQVLQEQGNSFAIIGDLQDLFQQGSALPQVSRDQQASFINGQRTDALKVSVGLSLLGGLIGAMTGTQVNLTTAFQKASKIVFHFSDVKVDNVTQTHLRNYLAASAALEGGFVRELEDDKLYVIISTIKSAKYTIEALDSSGKSVDVAVPIIQQMVGGSVGVKTEGSSQSVVTFEGTTPHVFGIQALRMEFKNRKFVTTKAASTGTAVRDVGDEEEEEKSEALLPEGPFLNLA